MRFFLFLLFSLFLNFNFSAQNWNSSAYFSASTPVGTANQNLGRDVAISGNYAIATINENNAFANVYKKVGINWSLQTSLTPLDGKKTSIAVAIFENYAAVSTAGAVYVFKKNNNGWSQHAKLTPSDTNEIADFGNDVAINNNYIIVGAKSQDQSQNLLNSGSAYIFKREGENWSQEIKLTATDAKSENFFGVSVDINNNNAIVGAHGAAYVFTLNNSWLQTKQIVGNNNNTFFGRSVGISNNTIVIGSSGSSRVYINDNNDWIYEATLSSFSYDSNSYLQPVAIDNNYIIVGHSQYGGNYKHSGNGAAYIFKRTNGIWSQEKRLDGIDKESYFGKAVSIANGLAIVGAPYEDFYHESGYTQETSEGNNSGALGIYKEVDPNAFITRWAVGNNESITIPTLTPGNCYRCESYGFQVDWGDGVVESLSSGNFDHIYEEAGSYDISITGQFPRIAFGDENGNSHISSSKISKIIQWGTIRWSSMNYAFAFCDNLEISAKDAPNLGDVSDLSYMFYHATIVNSNLNHWDVSNTLTMKGMFLWSNFDGDISTWDVSNVIDMSQMFQWSDFNGDISNWEVSSVVDMSSIFRWNFNFNRDISNWDVSNVVNMSGMFYGYRSNNPNAKAAFNQNLSKWNVSKVENMTGMFSNSSMSMENYDKTLQGWAQLSTLNENVSLGAHNVKYCTSEDARNTLINKFNWLISDDGLGCYRGETPKAADDTATVDAGSINNSISVLVNDEAGIDGFIYGGLTMTNGTLMSASVNDGLISVDNNGTADTNDDVFLYTPKAGFTGEDTFQYTITDASGDASTATVTITVNAVTNVPNAIADTTTTVEDTTVSVAVLNNDNFGSDGAASQNSLSVSGTSSKGGVTSILNNEIMYTPLAGFVGEDSFEYTIEDATGDTATAIVTITVSAKVNGTPTAIADVATVNQNSALNQITILANDNFGTDGANASHALTFSNGSTSSASANGGLIALSANGTPSDLTDDVIEYTPAKDFSGADQFEYVITDGNGDAARATVTITINPSTEVYTPTASDDTVTLTANSVINTIDVLANDESGLDGYIDGGLTMTNGTLISASTKGSAISIDNKNTLDTTDDEFNYIPSALAATDGTDTFSYTITDASGDASTATVTVTIGPAATDIPAALDDAETVVEDTTVSIDVLDNDVYGDDGAALVDALTVGATSDLGGTTSVVAGEIEYTPALNFVGTDTFEYAIEDGNGDTATATVTVTVTAEVIVNGTPTATDDFVTVSFESTNTIISVLSNDTFGSDGLNATHPLTLVNGKQSTASLEGGLISVSDNNTPNDASDDVVLYSAPADFNGADSFEYTITDLNGDASKATVSITVNSAKSSNDNTSFDEVLADSFKIYPNPSNGNINTILSSKVATEAQMILYDTTGRVVYKSTLKIEMGINQFDFNLEAKAGVLFMKIESNIKNFGIRKLVIK